ncbi:MAG: heparinase II/III family protein [Alphaproteobacteria bacterium]
MPLGILGQMRSKLGHGGGVATRLRLSSSSSWAFDSTLYNWSLRGDVPDRLIVRPVDPWCGDAEAGARLFDGVFRRGAGDALREYAVQGADWDAPDMPRVWAAHIHGFGWLRDLRSFANAGNGDQRRAARGFARHMILAWVDRYAAWSKRAWQADILGQRLSMWIAHYEFFAAEHLQEDEEFEEAFFDSLARQGRHLSRILSGVSSGGLSGCDSLAQFYAGKGMLYAGLALEGYEAWIEQGLDILLEALETQILGDGAHVSRSASQLLDVLQVLLDVRSALNAGGYPMPEQIQHGIDKIAPAVRFYRYNDKYFGCFEGANTGDVAHIDAVLAQSGSKGRGMNSLPCAGYERIAAGRSLLMFDCGGSPSALYSEEAHAAPLSFELSHARERIFVNCGSDEYDEMWRASMRCAAAHNGLVIDHRDPCEMHKNGRISRGFAVEETRREESKDGVFVEGVHDGYVPINGMAHRRGIYVSESGHDVRGVDALEGAAAPLKPLDIAVRFHLHPDVKVSLINEGREALLRLKSGGGWRFKHGGGVLALEDSVYLGGGALRKTKQLVIHGQVSAGRAEIKWGLSKEG